MSRLLEPSGQQLCIYLLRDGGAGEGRREVACQWESPEEDRREVGCQWERPEEDRKEVGCQWESPEEDNRDAAVQVDLMMQQLSWTRTGGWGCSRSQPTYCVSDPAGSDPAGSDPHSVSRFLRCVVAVCSSA